MESLYSVLRVSRDADAAALKAAYHSRLRQLHPDKGATEDNTAIRSVQRAYSVLSTSRAAYDAWLGEQEARRHRVVWETLGWAEFWASDEPVSCRCGDAFLPDPADRDRCPGDLLLACPSCSLCLRVTREGEAEK